MRTVWRTTWIKTHFLDATTNPPVGQGLLIFEASRSHSGTPRWVGLFFTSNELDAETSTWHTTRTRDIHAPGVIRPHFPSNVATVDQRLRLRGHWDRQVNKNSALRCSRRRMTYWVVFVTLRFWTNTLQRITLTLVLQDLFIHLFICLSDSWDSVSEVHSEMVCVVPSVKPRGLAVWPKSSCIQSCRHLMEAVSILNPRTHHHSKRDVGIWDYLLSGPVPEDKRWHFV